jgi:hypothetical protein
MKLNRKQDGVPLPSGSYEATPESVARAAEAESNRTMPTTSRGSRVPEMKETKPAISMGATAPGLDMRDVKPVTARPGGRPMSSG